MSNRIKNKVTEPMNTIRLSKDKVKLVCSLKVSSLITTTLYLNLSLSDRDFFFFASKL